MTSSAIAPLYTLVEGHGEVQAVPVLLSRLGHHLGVRIPWAATLRWKNIHLWEPRHGGRGGLLQGLEFLRHKRNVGGVLVLRDEDDECPKRVAPGISALIDGLDLPFRTAVTLLRPEYEVLFLPCLHRMQRAGFSTRTRWDHASWEARRDIKGWLSSQLPGGKSYKPTTDQKPMTEQIDFDELDAARVPCFGSLARAVRFLGGHEPTGRVYPPPPEPPVDQQRRR